MKLGEYTFIHLILIAFAIYYQEIALSKSDDQLLN